MNDPVPVTVEDVEKIDPHHTEKAPLTKAQKARKAKNKVAKQSRKKNRN